MSSTREEIAVAVMVTLCAPSFAQAQTATTEKTIITGSNIKRIDAEPVAPVDVITRDQIERTGLPTIAEVLKNVPSNTGGSFMESFSNSFSPGASGISLRGLGQKTTLVLINGRRTTGYGFAQNLQDTFVDLNSIPSSAVERVEVLKDGASAIYGSDAIAGVVNIILRRDYRGVEVGGNVGRSEGKNDYQFNLTGGIGDLEQDRYNLFGVFDYYKRDLLLFSDTEFGRSRDKRGEQGGRNHTGLPVTRITANLSGLGTWHQLNETGGFTNNYRAISECEQVGGSVYTSAQAVDAGLFAFNNRQNTPGSTFCAYDIFKVLTALPKTERYGFLSRGTFEVVPNTQAYAEIGYSRTETFQTFTQPTFANQAALQPVGSSFSLFSFETTFAPGVAGNPFNTPARYVGSLGGIGTRDATITSDTGRFLAGLKYTFAGWDGDSAIGYSKNEVESDYVNRLSKTAVAATFGVPATPQATIPTSTSSSYNLDRPSLNPEAVRNQFLISVPRKAESQLAFADTRLSTEFGNLPGGPIGVALGVEFRNEKLKDRPAENAQSGDVLGQGITATDGKRDSFAVYTEFALPLLRQVEAQAAVRRDHYSDFGNSITPKLGIKIKATPSLLLRANWGRGFRAPTLVEISPSAATFFQQVNDRVTNTTPQVFGVFTGNPDLKAEKSISTTIGVVFEPSPNFNMGLNLYEIDWRNKVFGDCCQAAVDAGGPNVVRDPITRGIVTVFSNFVNQGSTITRGYDFDAKYSFGTGVGRFTTRLAFTYVDTYKINGVEIAGTNDPVNGITVIPRVKGSLAMDWDQGPLSMTGRMNYTHHFRQKLLPGSWFIPGGIAGGDPNDTRFQNGVFPDFVPRYITYDLFAKFNVTKNLAISGSIINMTNETPPYDPGYSATNLFTFDQFDVRGRQFRIGLQYKM
jgi:iron complex outermembrane receptor protein